MHVTFKMYDDDVFSMEQFIAVSLLSSKILPSTVQLSTIDLQDYEKDAIV